MAILTDIDIISFKTNKKMLLEIAEHFIVTKESIHQKDITIINIYAANDRAPKSVKQKLKEMEKQTIQQ